MPSVVKEAPETDADPRRMRDVDVTGRQRRPTRKRQRPAERPDALDVLEIRQRARTQFLANDTILGARAQARLSAQDKAARRLGGPHNGARPLMSRWAAFLEQRGGRTLTRTQARSLRRRSTVDELARLDGYQRALLGVTL